jgi:hypothetical protein
MAFGGRDHSTVMHACEKVQSLREEDPIFNEDYKNFNACYKVKQIRVAMRHILPHSTTKKHLLLFFSC